MSWEIFERIYSSHWFLSSYNGPGFVYDFPKMGGGSFMRHAIYIMEKDMCRYVFDRDEFERAAHFTADRLINDDVWRNRIYRKIDYYTRRYFEAGERLRAMPLQTFTDQKMANVIRAIVPLQRYHQVYSILVNGVVLDGRNHLSNKIRDELQQILNNPKQFNEYWSLLTLVTKMSLRQKKDYAIALLAKDAKKLSRFVVQQRIKRLHEKYCWLDYNNMGPASSLAQFEQEFQEAMEQNQHLHLREELAVLKKRQQKLMEKLNFNARARFLIWFAQYVIWQKSYRKDMQYHGFYCYEPYFRELARRRDVDDWQTLIFLLPWEVEHFILKESPSVQELKERRKFSCFTVGPRNKSLKIGLPARRFVKRLGLMEDFSHLKGAKGQCAYAGKACGGVKIVQVPADMQKMKKGDILVSQATSPDLLPAMKKAAAIVTNTGGLICHAAITARELKIPCVVGTTNATLIFKDGDRVEVDAERGIVTRLDK